MKSLLMMAPRPWANVVTIDGDGSGSANLLTPDPKEAWITANVANAAIRLGFAQPQTIDTAHIGFADLPHGTNVDFYTFTSADVATQLFLGRYTVDNPAGDTRLRHAFVQGAPRAGVVAVAAAILPPAPRVSFVGVMSAGLAFVAQWGHEYGAGRPIWDTGNKERLFGGGFGLLKGARGGGYNWTFGDLSDAETETLYKLALDVGLSSSVLVIENPDTAEANLNERIHWGVMDRIDVYERFAPGATRWALQVVDWA